MQAFMRSKLGLFYEKCDDLLFFDGKTHRLNKS